MRLLFALACLCLPLLTWGAEPPSVLIVAGSASEPAKLRMLLELGRDAGLRVDTVNTAGQDPERLGQRMLGYDAVLLDYVYMGALMPVINSYRGVLARHPGVVFPGLMWRDPSLVRGLSPERARTLFAYYDNGGRENYRRMYAWMRHTLFGQGDPAAPPIVYPDAGYYHPDYPQRVFASLEALLTWRAPAGGQPVIGVGLHRTVLAADTTMSVDAVIHGLEARGVYAFGYYHDTTQPMAPMMRRDGAVFPDLLISFRGIMTSPDLRAAELAELDVPMLDALDVRMDSLEQWMADDQGFPMFAMGPWFVQAEMAGMIDPTVISTRTLDDGHVLVPGHLESLVQRSLNYIKLRRTPNADKHLAMLVWNSPEGEENFSASFLNLPESIVGIETALQQAGYRIEPRDGEQIVQALQSMMRPYYRVHSETAMRELLAQDLAEAVPVAAYRAWFESLPETVRTETMAAWGDPAQTYLNLDLDGERVFVIPRLKLGNLLLLPQPLRGDKRDREKDILHDKRVPVHHAYRAVYHYLVHHYRADAIIHLGTHGTQEWLPGKELGTWKYDDTQTTVGDVPVIYPYNVQNVGEAQIAKRRGRAVVISHNTPPFAPAGLYDELTVLHELTHNYRLLEDGRVRQNTAGEILDKLVELELDQDLALDVAREREALLADFQPVFERVHAYLEQIAGMAQPLGMHTYGEVAETDHVLLTILQILGPDYIAAAERSAGVTAGSDGFFTRPYAEILETASFRLLKRALTGDESLDAFDPAIRDQLAEGRRHYANFLGEREMEHLLAALEARYIPTGTGNDPLRNPDAVPTGRNVFAFDPDKIPTRAAWEAGQTLAQDLIDTYKAKHGVYPDKLAFSLWSTETLKHYGVLEAEVLYLLGVRPVWNRRDDVVDVEVIPMSELKRPRVDVVLSATGLYRDNLSPVMDRLSRAVLKVAALAEPDNPLHANAEALRRQLIERGIAPEQAERLSRVRMFANQSGVYGTQLPDATLASDTWDDEAPLAQTYLSRMGYLYGAEDGTRNVKLDDIDLYAENLRGTKAAVFSRSSNLHGILSIDHPFEYLGGIGLAVRHLDGSTPDMYISDLRNSRDFRNDTVADFISKELRTRYYHPRWVAEMMADGYSGANEILDVVNNFWGWNVMDRDSVRADQWQALYEIYVEDRLELGVDEWFKQVHPAARAQIAERMLEAVRKGYWDAPDAVVRRLTEVWLEIAENRDLYTENQVFKDYVAATAAGFGLDPGPARRDPQSSAEAAPESTRTVEGIRLERTASTETEPEPRHWLLLALLLGLFLLGALHEHWRGHPPRPA